MIQSILSRASRAQLKESLGVILGRIIGIVLTVLTGFLLARGLGPAEYGKLGFGMSVLGVLTLLVNLGFPNVLMREVGKAIVHHQWGEVRALRRFTFLWSLLLGGGIVVGFHLFLEPWVNPSDKWMAVIWLSPYLVCSAWLGLQTSMLWGAGRVVVGNFPVYDLLYGGGIALLMVLHRGSFGLKEVAWVLIASLLVAAMIFQAVLQKTLPPSYTVSPPTYRIRAWFASALPIFLAGSLFTLNSQADILMLGVFRSNEEIGIYRLAVRLAAFISFPLIVANASIGPRVASYYLRGEMETLARWARSMIRVAFVAAVGVWVGMLLLGRWGLGLAGEAYRAGYPALLLLGVGQLVNVAAGSVGWVLQMTHNEKDAAVGVGFALLLNVLLNALLTPRFGFMGTALATTLSLVGWNVILSLFVWKRFRIRVGVL